MNKYGLETKEFNFYLNLIFNYNIYIKVNKFQKLAHNKQAI